jgi:histidinol-phosphate aminotransferase
VQVVIDRLTAERDRVAVALRDAGWEVPDAHANFVWLPLGERTDEVFPALERRGVVVRPFPGVGIRVTIGTPAENDRFLEVLADLD